VSARLTQLSFGARIALTSAVGVALAVVLASALVYIVARGQLRAPVDEALERRQFEISANPPLARAPLGNGQFGLTLQPEFGEAGYVQLVIDGKIFRPLRQDITLPADDRVLEVAAGREPAFWSDTEVDGQHLRVFTFAGGGGAAWQVARPLDEVDESLRRLGLLLLLIAAGGIAVAAVLGLLVSRAALAPVTRLTETAERVSETGDLSERIEVGGGDDELSRLASSFNTMLGALEDSTRAQRQLVADASHELRTPLTSLRTNIEVLAGNQELPAEERRRLLSDVVEQLEEMTTLIAELIELARAEQQPAAEPEDLRLDLLTSDAIERVQRNRPGVAFAARLEESVVRGVPDKLERAIGNLLDNAAKWSPPDASVDVEVRDGSVVVRDHGPGIADEDLPYVFDRFYRARSARGMPGSGLGLAIVRQVAEAHGGEVVAERAPGGGTRMVLRLNGAGAEAPAREPDATPREVLPTS
jgi:two-component system, OmpR family, sensor histidine kinase MprB